jgi:hypothetical protein
MALFAGKDLTLAESAGGSTEGDTGEAGAAGLSALRLMQSQKGELTRHQGETGRRECRQIH